MKGTTITLHPVVATLVEAEVKRCNSLPLTKRDLALNSIKPTTPDAIVNEYLWMALRTGDIGKHYTQVKQK